MYPYTNSDYIRHVPNYTRAHDVDSVDVEQLDRDTFLRRFVDRNRPCLVRGAARQMAGMREVVIAGISQSGVRRRGGPGVSPAAP